MRNTSFVPARFTLLSRSAEHALRATLFLGRSKGNGLIPAREIAAALGTPPNYMSKILRRLSLRGLLHSVRGPHGGFELQMHPRSLTVAVVVEAVDEPEARRPVCLLGDRYCDASTPCGAHGLWTELEGRMGRLLNETTVEDLLRDPTHTPSLDSATALQNEVNQR